MLALCNGVRASYLSDASPFAIPFSALLTGGRMSHRAGLTLDTLTLLFLWHSVPVPHPSSSGSTFHPVSSDNSSMKHPLHCWILILRNFVKEESVCRVKTFPFSWPGLIYQRYFAISTQLFSKKEHRVFFYKAIGPANILALGNLTKHNVFLQIVSCFPYILNIHYMLFLTITPNRGNIFNSNRTKNSQSSTLPVTTLVSFPACSCSWHVEVHSEKESAVSKSSTCKIVF